MTKLDQLYEQRAKMEEHIETIPGFSGQYQDFTGWQEINEEIEIELLSPEERTKRALCQTCNIAKDLRRCDDCKFKAYNYLHIGEAAQIVWGNDPLEFVDDWAADPNEFELNPLQLGCSQEYIDSLPSILEDDNRP